MLVAAEAFLQLAALVVHDRETPWREGAAHRVLCVGDSHTYGAGMTPADAYPGQLERVLDAQAPGGWSVVNKGVPGFSTTQVRERLPDLLARFRPDVVIVWCGVNDSWSYARPSPFSSVREALQSLALHTRLYRLFRVWRHDLRLQAAGLAATEPADPRVRVSSDRPYDVEKRQTVDWGDTVEHVDQRAGPSRSADEHEALAREEYRAMVAIARAAKVPIVFIAYPAAVQPFIPANEAMRAVAAETGVPLVDAARSIARLPPEQIQFRWALHPNAPMYREIARDVADVVLALPAASQAGPLAPRRPAGASAPVAGPPPDEPHG